MSIPFQDSETAKNLLRAFAGESQARNRYDFAANLCQKQELQAMAFIFQATAIEGTNRILELLRAAQHNEHEEHGSVYPSFAAIATQEGFPEAAASFRQIAAIEQLHGERFGLLADQLESGALFVSQIETGWMCLNCGHTQNSLEAPKQCPVCNHGQGWFIRLELAPWSPVVKQT